MKLICDEMMATEDITDCMFTVGSLVSCLTCYDLRIDGEVIAFDYTKRLLVLKANSSDGNSNHNDIHCLNLESVKDVTVKKEVKREDVVNTQLPQINTSKVEDRYRRAVDERKRLADAFNAGAGAEGIKLWLQLNKTMSRDVVVSWDGDSIIVDNSVRIAPPYKADNCTALKTRANSPQNSLNYTKKLVEKFWNDQKLAATAPVAKPTAASVVAGGPQPSTPPAAAPVTAASIVAGGNKNSATNSVQPTDKPPFNNTKG
ncbi:unnamed protein product [Medioppia subpectinata]|uniref:AD domain-containing protein n=1 Tax=Medioppia subpectinata TaxID=1979941 RepID=A0A7R9L2P1_9ACAR|nr:unnamed protein product [Medioppia subpectinata]CAG2113214.1 unnamed protein product [Medioppia subpectinata]